MKVVNSLRTIPTDAIHLVSRGDGTWDVYEEGDTIPEHLVVVPESNVVNSQQFRDRFTNAELGALLLSTDARVRGLLFKVQTNRDGIDILSADVQAGLALITALGIIAAGRARTISHEP